MNENHRSKAELDRYHRENYAATKRAHEPQPEGATCKPLEDYVMVPTREFREIVGALDRARKLCLELAGHRLMQVAQGPRRIINILSPTLKLPIVKKYGSVD